MAVNHVTTGYVAEIVSLVLDLRSQAATIILANAITILSNDTKASFTNAHGHGKAGANQNDHHWRYTNTNQNANS